jgi:hypothetical protein
MRQLLFLCGLFVICFLAACNRIKVPDQVQSAGFYADSLRTQKVDTNVANIFVLAGQSNAVGVNSLGNMFTVLPSRYRDTQKLIKVWRNGNAPFGVFTPGFENMLIPLNTRDKSYNDTSSWGNKVVGWGVEQELMHRAQFYYNDNVYLIKSAIDSVSISNWNQINGGMYYQLRDMMVQAENTLAGKGKKVKFRGLIWMQGESDSGNANYYQQLYSLLFSLRSISNATANMPAYMVKIPTNSILNSKRVNSAIDQLVADKPTLNFEVNTAKYPSIQLFDGVHYDDISKLRIGGEIFLMQYRNKQLD